MKRVVRKRLWKLKEDVIRERYERRVQKLVHVNAHDLWKSFAWEQVGQAGWSYAWWWNEDVKDAVAKKKKT